MFKDLNLEEFLEKNRIDQKTWDKANIDWSTLQAIATDHEANSVKLEDWAEVIAKTIQKFSKVHSVRWRVKNAEHLISKIIRKRSDENPKYADITLENYFERVTDLVGVRALHLFKIDCFEIDKSIKETWTELEHAVAYIRSGDSNEMENQFKNQGFEVKKHNAGYRSIHYVIESIPHKRKTITEIQVRTIFEEGWSEIDHTIRYPNFSDNEQIGYFLAIFNRMAGSADDMGGFVLGLVETLNQLQNEIILIKKEKDITFSAMEQALSQLESVKKQDDESKANLTTLKEEIAKLKNTRNENALGLGGLSWSTGLVDINKTSARAGLLGGLKGHEALAKALESNGGLNALSRALTTPGNIALANALKSNSAFETLKKANESDPFANILKKNIEFPAPKGLLDNDIFKK